MSVIEAVVKIRRIRAEIQETQRIASEVMYGSTSNRTRPTTSQSAMTKPKAQILSRANIASMRRCNSPSWAFVDFMK